MDISLDKPATYHICVRGYLDERWAKRLGGLTITPITMAPQTTITLLSGPVADQAALFGVLLALYDLRLPLVSVFCEEHAHLENKLSPGDHDTTPASSDNHPAHPG